jgi:DNA-binding NarL/FixJ family response regulator
LEKTNQEIANALQLSLTAVEKRRRRIYIATGTKSAAGLVMWLVNNNDPAIIPFLTATP